MSPELFGHQEVEGLLDNARSLVAETATRLGRGEAVAPPGSEEAARARSTGS
jgi:hypothetical protein